MIASSCAAGSGIPTPCVRICTMDPSGRCAGCARTLTEIASWTSLSASARLRIMEELPARKAAPAIDSSPSSNN